jgi:hypothetical protein
MRPAHQALVRPDLSRKMHGAGRYPENAWGSSLQVLTAERMPLSDEDRTAPDAFRAERNDHATTRLEREA